jgi:hypothetical protein
VMTGAAEENYYSSTNPICIAMIRFILKMSDCNVMLRHEVSVLQRKIT